MLLIFFFLSVFNGGSKDQAESSSAAGLIFHTGNLLAPPSCSSKQLSVCQSLFSSPAEQDLSAVALTASEEVQHLTKKTGENVTFDLGVQDLKHDDHVVWSHGASSSVIYNVYIGKDQINQRRRFDLSLRTGSLTIHALSSGDADVYLGQIINGRGTRKRFNLTVEDPIPVTSDPPHNREPWVIAVIVIGCIFCVGLFSYALKTYFEKTRADLTSSSSSSL
ncbi:uncharacterized protein LOC116719458 isoform X1 [Xiphophorus hellerii]|uniref:uncharacterized protein LOC116719458 isoform X1 n=1 Tax=Xiphophorus hellerii TaxID=8084 RepID=UPI0013B47601|nr:uncharacterized protein LOC116719458 isoform X1 [Xiphophorus hellerii]XP_032417864.1 uncharacterized protein LOC116719458 isoform X1 [Xiphophorus hellerii]